MPSVKSHSTISRQWELLQHLPKKGPGINVSALLARLEASGYAVSRRTVERDLNDLSLVFPLLSTETAAPQAWSWAPGVSVELQGISLTEALSLAMVEDAIRPLLPASMLSALTPRFEHARQKLKGLEEDNAAARWLDKVASVRPELNMLPPNIDASVLETLQRSLIEERQLRCSYYSAHTDKLSSMTLNPLAMVQRGPVTYMIATVEGFSDIRQFAVHRFRQAEPLATGMERPVGFSLREYLASDALQFGSPEKIQFQAWVGELCARLLRETPLSPDMVLEKVGDRYQVRATLNNTWQLRWWILAQGPALVVEKPVALRAQIAQALSEACAGYAEPPPMPGTVAE